MYRENSMVGSSPWHHKESDMTKRLKLSLTESVIESGFQSKVEKEMATHSCILDWRIPGTEEPGGLQFTGLQRVGLNLVTKQQQIRV